MEWIKANKVNQFTDNQTVKVGDRIKIYGKESRN